MGWMQTAAKWLGVAEAPLPLGMQAGEHAVSDTRYVWPYGPRMLLPNPDDLVGRKSLKVYDDMRRDDQVKAALSLKKAAILGPGWTVEPGDPEDPRAVELSERVTEQIDNIDGSFRDTLWSIMSALDYGFSLTEKVWDMTGAPRLKALKTRGPHDFWFDVDPFGNILGMYQQATNKQDPLPIEKFIHFTVNAEFGNPYGESDLRAAHLGWFIKQQWVQWWAVFGEMLATPPVIGKIGAVQDANAASQFAEKLRRIQARTAFAIPADWGVELLETGRDPQNFFGTSVDRFDLMIARAILVPEKLGFGGGGETGSGSFALSKTHLGAFFFILDALGKRLEGCIQDQLVTPLAAWLDGGAEIPTFKLLPASEDDHACIITSWLDAVAKGAVANTIGDENRLRQLLDFPEREGDPSAPGGKEQPEPQALGPDGQPVLPDQAPGDKPEDDDTADMVQRFRAIDPRTLSEDLRPAHARLAAAIDAP